MKTLHRFFALVFLFVLLAFTLVAPVKAFDERSGETVVIKADEVIEDDLYVSAANFTLDGTVKGDLVVFGTVITINGTIEGDLIAAGQSIVINGKVTDDARIAGAVLQVGSDASIGDDLVAAGASLEVKDGSQVGGEVAVGAAQVLLAGDVAGDVLAGTGALELRGQFGGNVKAEVGNPEQDAGGPPISMFIPNNEVPMPSVIPGLTISKDAKIKGDLEYTQSVDAVIPADVVGGKITRTEPVVDPATVEVKPTPAQAAMTWAFDLLRAIVTLTLIGLLLWRLMPSFTETLMNKLQAKPIASFGWGIVAYAAFFFAILIVLVVMIAGGIFFGTLTLSGLSATIVWVGILAIFTLTVLFVISIAFITKIAVAWLGGKLILDKLNPAMADHQFIPLIVGVVILAVLMAIPYIGWVFKLLAVFLGLGAIWMWGSELWQARTPAA